MNKEAPSGHKFVTRTGYGEDVETTEQILVPLFDGPTAKVTVSGHYTVNLGNYQSARIGVEIALPCYPNDEELIRTADHISALVGELIQEQVKQIQPQ
jgi:hypothetical protein